MAAKRPQFAPEIADTYRRIRAGEAVQWLIVAYDSPPEANKDVKFVLKESGEGGLDALAWEFTSSSIEYAVIRIEDAKTNMEKVVFISWIAQSCPDRLKAFVGRDVPSVAAVFNAHVQINARSEDDIKTEVVMALIAKGAGADYSSHGEGRGMKATAPRPAPKPKPAGGVRIATAEKPKCVTCGLDVFIKDEVRAMDLAWHKACFKCSTCNIALNLKTFKTHAGSTLYCATHLPRVGHTAVADDVQTQRAVNAPKRTLAQGARTDLAGGQIIDRSKVDASSFERAEAPANQTTESRPAPSSAGTASGPSGGGAKAAPGPAKKWGPGAAAQPAAAAAPPPKAEPKAAAAPAKKWGNNAGSSPAPAAAAPAPAPAPAAAPAKKWGASPAPAKAPEPEPEPEPSWGEEAAAEPAADQGWGAEPAAEEQGWGTEAAAEPAADQGWGAEPAAEEQGWGTEAAAEPAADQGWGAEPAAEEQGWGTEAAAEPAAEEGWGAEPAAEEGWGAEAAAEPAAEEGWGAEAAAAEPAAYTELRVLYEYTAAEAGEIDLYEGEIIWELEVLNEGWSTGQKADGQTGLFPRNYCE